MKEIININKKNTQRMMDISNNEKLITEEKHIANEFNNFFCNILKQIEKFILPAQKTYDEFITNSIEKSFKFDLTFVKEIIAHIHQNTKKQ